ncbi:MAG TPA: DoxX family membrane protein [Candidatus Omnitrophota bacterium]|nr:DoxX family membrane protein [Candidatus Omnitrophota bacterium]
MKINSEYGKILLRISLSLLLIWFGISQISSPAEWTGFVPGFVANIIPAHTVVFINGSAEIVFGLFMLVGFYLRLSSFLMGLHLFVIALGIGYNSLAIRDFGLSLAMLSLFLLGPDKFCADKKFEKKEETEENLK